MELDAPQLARFIKTSLKLKFIDSYKRKNEPSLLEKISYCDQFKNEKTVRALTLEAKDNSKFLVLVLKQK